jgi:hypothetical protein
MHLAASSGEGLDEHELPRVLFQQRFAETEEKDTLSLKTSSTLDISRELCMLGVGLEALSWGRAKMVERGMR